MICPNCDDIIKPEMLEFMIVDPYSPARIYFEEAERPIERPEYPVIKDKGMAIESIFVCPKCGTVRANLNGM